MTIAYIRVYLDNESDENQVEVIGAFAKSKHIQIDRWSRVIGDSTRNKNELDNLIKTMTAGDQLIISDISRLSIKLMEVVKIIVNCMERKILIYSISEGYIFKDDINSKTLAFTFGVVSEIEHKLQSIRTKEALVYTKGKGTVLGRPRGGRLGSNKLLPYKDTIAKELKDGDMKVKEILEKYQVTPYVLSRFVKEYLSKKTKKDQGKKGKGGRKYPR